MNDDIEQMITDCENRESRLSDWERSFIDSLRKQLGDGFGITEKQENKLEQIWEQVTE